MRYKMPIICSLTFYFQLGNGVGTILLTQPLIASYPAAGFQAHFGPILPNSVCDLGSWELHWI
ncbi:hypothetical protein I79_024110 [Cricetulus griseus]|uniref:Uncharacterized protein n=1 Tax=Cricetulus griseus TaxID=10029 RepID=G3IJS4_CRIGR|nr:hypothetical protein I79_024110 [Cricetulus griseus]